MIDYKKEINALYLEQKKDGFIENKLQFIGDVIFDFTTYDSAMDELLAQKMLQVIECIVSSKTFEYQEISLENYMNYITMVNMPFLQGKLEWGTSIRGAWFDEYVKEDYKIGSSNNFTVPGSEIVSFLTALIEWSKVK